MAERLHAHPAALADLVVVGAAVFWGEVDPVDGVGALWEFVKHISLISAQIGWCDALAEILGLHFGHATGDQLRLDVAHEIYKLFHFVF